MLLIFLILSLLLNRAPQIIYLQPYNGFTHSEAVDVKDSLEVHFSEIMDRPFEIRILSDKTLPKDFRNHDKSGFRADSIINFEKELCPDKCFMIGLMHEDLFYTNKNNEERGVYGLSSMYGNVSVISTFRPGKNEDLWKLILHEFLHSYYHLGHCEKDDPHCIMQEGHGLPRLNEKNDLCDDCKERIEHKITLSKYGLLNHRPL